MLVNDFIVGGSCGASHSCVLNNDGEILSWGRMKTICPYNGDYEYKFLVLLMLKPSYYHYTIGILQT